MESIATPAVLNILKVFVAMLCGGLIGLERTTGSEAAEIRILLLVGMGAALFMVTASSGTIPNLFNMAAPVMIGAGLLGAGLIVREKGAVSGISSAVSVWVVAAIGSAIGSGLFIEGIFITVVTYLVLGWLRRFVNA